MTDRSQEIAELAEELRQHGAMWFRDGLLLKLNRLIEIAEVQNRTLAAQAKMVGKINSVWPTAVPEQPK